MAYVMMRYDLLLCCGIAPSAVYFGLWTKGSISEGQAGRLVPMRKGSNSDFKLTKRVEQLEVIDCFEEIFSRYV